LSGFCQEAVAKKAETPLFEHGETTSPTTLMKGGCLPVVMANPYHRLFNFKALHCNERHVRRMSVSFARKTWMASIWVSKKWFRVISTTMSPATTEKLQPAL
jgi:hypothetical protein